MSVSLNNRKYSASNTISFLATLLFTLPVLAVQPMSEYDLEIVSATTGANILNIFGASQAGLTIEHSDTEISNTSSVKLDSEQFSEGEATTSIALKELREIEKERLQPTNNNSELPITNEFQQTILKVNEQTTGNATAFTTSSEINYKTNNVHHEMRKLEGDAVGVSRELQIDSLKLENLRGAHFDESRSAGSIYISDWHSQGDTRIMNTK